MQKSYGLQQSQDIPWAVNAFSNKILRPLWGFIKQFVFDYQYNDNHCRCQCRIKPIISRQRRQGDNLYICQAEELSPIDIYWGACKVSGTDTFCYNLTWSIFSEINASETNLLLWNSYWKNMPQIKTIWVVIWNTS